LNSTASQTKKTLATGRLAPLMDFFRRFGPLRWSAYVVRYWSGQRAVIAIPYFWLMLFFLVPFLLVFKISFAEYATAQPPYTALIQEVEQGIYTIKLNLQNYLGLFNDDLYYTAYLYSLKVAAVSTFFCLLVGYPMAYAISRSTPAQRNLFLMLIILPFWTSFLLRVYAWVGLLKTDGVINNVAAWFGLGPYTMMYTSFAVYIGIVYSYLPFMILPLYSNLEKHDLTLIEAAQDLGAHPMKAFFTITLPLSMPGVIAGCLLVFIPAVGEYVIPSLLGSSDQLMIGRVLTDEFFSNRDWPVASAVAIVMLVLLLLPIIYFQRFQNKELEARK
jgi:putrescine transport system permease protein